MAKREERQVTLIAQFRDRITVGLQKLGRVLGLVETDSDKLTRAGRTLTTAWRGVNRVFDATGRAASRVVRGAFGLITGAIRGLFNALTSLRTLVLAFIAGAVAQRIVGFLRDAVEEMDALTKAAIRFGVSVQSLDRLQFVAKLAGVEVNTLTQAVQRMTRRVAEAAQGTGEAQGALRELGIDAAAFRDLSLEDQFALLADRMQQVDRPADRLRLAFKLFDSEGAALVQLLGQGGDELRALIAEADRLGTITARQSAIAASVSDALARVSRAWRSLKFAIVEAIGPELERLLNGAASAIAKFGERFANIATGITAAIRDPFAAWLLRYSASGLMDTVLRLLQRVGSTLAIAFVQAIVIGLEAAAPILRMAVERLIGQSIIEGVAAVIEKVVRTNAKIRDALGINFDLFQAIDREYLSLLREGVAATDEWTSSQERWAEAFRQAGQTFRENSQVFTDAIDAIKFDVGEASIDIANMLRAIELYGEAIRDAFQGQTPGAPDEPGGQSTEGLFSHFIGGIRQVATELGTLADVARNVGRTIGDALTRGVSSVITDIIRGTREWKEAFRELAASVLADVAQMILQFSILRALQGIPGIGGWFSPVAGAAVGMNAGGLVPGSGPNVDSVPTMLTPGEFVLNRGAAAAIGHSILGRVNRMYAGGITLPSVGLNAGGLVSGGEAAPAAAVPAYIVPSNDNVEEFMSRGLQGFLSFASQHARSINNALAGA